MLKAIEKEVLTETLGSKTGEQAKLHDEEPLQ